METQISVVVPVYNSEPYLRDCLDSILSQDVDGIEIICIDDGSTDGSPAILDQYASEHCNILVIHKVNERAGVARNVGISRARGKYIAFLDSDDAFEHHALKTMFEAAEDEDADVVRATGFEYGASGRRNDISWCLRKKYLSDRQVFSWNEMPQQIFNISAGNPWAMLVRRDMVEKYGIRFLEVPRTEDIYFTYDCYLKARRIVALHDQVVFHRSSEAGMENTKVNFPLVPLEARHLLLEKIKKDGYYDEVYIGFWFAAFHSYVQMMRLLLNEEDSEQYVKAYYDDIRSVIDQHPDLLMDRKAPMAQEISDIYDDLFRIVTSRDFQDFYGSFAEILEKRMAEKVQTQADIEERFRIKAEKDAESRQDAIKRRMDPSQETVKFSVIIPVYNASKYIRECLDHLVNQSYTNLEIICVDDGSSDDSCEIIGSYGNIKLIRQDNSGAGIARNNGFSHATGDYVLFMDGDDWVEYDMFSRVFQRIRDAENPPDMVMYSYTRFDDVTGVFRDYPCFKDGRTEDMVSDITKDPDFFLNNDFVIPWNKVVSARFIRENNLEYPDFKVSNDRPFYFAAIYKARNVIVINDTLINYRINSKSVTSIARLANFKCHYETYKLVEDDYLKADSHTFEKYIDITMCDMFHFFDVSTPDYKNIIGRQICEYSQEMHLDKIEDVAKYWWFRKIVNLKTEYSMPVSEGEMKAVAEKGDRVMQYILATAYANGTFVSSDSYTHICLLMQSSDQGYAPAKDMLSAYANEQGPKYVDVCTSLAVGGNPNAQYRLAKMYLDGRDVEKDLIKATEWARIAADAGHPGSEMTLIELLYSNGSEDNYPELLERCTRLAESGNKDAMFRLSRMYHNGRGVPVDPEMERYWLECAASKGHRGALNELGDSTATEVAASFDEEYLNALVEAGSEQSLSNALEYCTIEAGRGNAIAMYHLARLYRDGRGVTKDLDQALIWMQKAADNGYGRAKNECCDILNMLGTPESYRQAFIRAMINASLGDSGAMQRIGRAYRDGLYVEKDYAKAIEWMRKAYETNLVWQLEFFELLWITGTEESLALLQDLSLESISRNRKAGLAYLGRMYRYGKGAPKNLGSSADWYRKANASGVSWITNELFDVLWQIGNPESYVEMVAIITPLAESGEPGAMGRLARAYRDGKGVQRDLVIAADYMRSAMEKKVGWAPAELMDILWKIGTPESYAESVSLALPLAESGNGPAMDVMGRACREGKGTEKDMDASERWYLKAIDAGIKWSINGLFDTYLAMGTPDSYDRMIRIIVPYAESGDGGAMGRLARAYRDGKGVDQNPALAKEWMQKAADKGISWAIAEVKNLD